ncbi:MAG: hypothetical protein ACRBC3_00330 [Burkholderiaceae bacterium]
MTEFLARLPMKKLIAFVLVLSAMLLLNDKATAQSPEAGGNGLNVGLILDGTFSTRELALGARGKGFGLGHTEVSANTNIDDWFRGQVTAALGNHEGELEVELEEAYLETLALPAGLSIRAGRFLSQVGYLNGQHLHADDFSERPLMYRAFLGGHYYDDGLRANYLLPTPMFWQLGIEVLSGKSLISERTNDPGVGAISLSSRAGGDIGSNHSWQFGLGYLRNRLQAVMEEEEGEAEEGHDHAHEHGANYAGKHMFITDLVWKWAPNGNSRNRQLKLSAEYARITEPNEFASDQDRHDGWYLAGVYRFHPQWEVGARFGEIKVSEPHDDHFHKRRIKESSLMLAYKRSEFSALRVQLTRQVNGQGFDAAEEALILQYVMTLGAHGAHSF